jgi:hypothetical protein
VLVNALWGWQQLLLRASPARAGQLAPFAALVPLAICVPAVLFYVLERARTPEEPGAPRRSDIAEFYRIPSGPGAAANALAQQAVFADLARIAQTTPEAARVMWYIPGYVSLLAQRHGVPLERPADSAGLAAQLRATDADYVYLAALHPRDSAQRGGNPLDALVLARAFGEIAWHRERGGQLQSALLKVDKERLGGRVR